MVCGIQRTNVYYLKELKKAIDKIDDDAEKELDDLIVEVDGQQMEDDSMISSESDSENTAYESDSSRGSYVDTDDILWRNLAFFAEPSTKYQVPSTK